jgi:hypothetical protein
VAQRSAHMRQEGAGTGEPDMGGSAHTGVYKAGRGCGCCVPLSAVCVW